MLSAILMGYTYDMNELSSTSPGAAVDAVTNNTLLSDRRPLMFVDYSPSHFTIATTVFMNSFQPKFYVHIPPMDFMLLRGKVV